MSTENYLYSEETQEIIGTCYEVHRTLGAGFLEAVYKEALQYEFDDFVIPYEPEKELDIWYKKRKLRKKYIADFICFDKIIVEIKAVETLTDEHTGQVLNYLNATKLRLGLLINFGSRKMQIKRVIL
jgi:GxxExxY protein